MGKKIIWALAIWAFAGTAVNADTLSFTDSVALTQTDWSSSVSIPRFNPALGTLNSITFELRGESNSNLFGDNFSSSTLNITHSVTVTTTLFRPNNTSLVVTLPTASHAQLLQPDEGDNPPDFGGTDGYNVFVIGSDSDSATSIAPGDLALFTGLAPIVLPVGAVASANITGDNGNVDNGNMTFAAADVRVTYDFTPFASAVPVPPSIILAGFGAAGVGLFGWRGRRRAG